MIQTQTLDDIFSSIKEKLEQKYGDLRLVWWNNVIVTKTHSAHYYRLVPVRKSSKVHDIFVSVVFTGSKIKVHVEVRQKNGKVKISNFNY